VESRERSLLPHRRQAAGASILRGGAYKPRTSPYDFQDLGIEALKRCVKFAKKSDCP